MNEPCLIKKDKSDYVLGQSGKKISDLFAMSESDIKTLIQEQIDNTKSSATQFEYFTSQMISAASDYDEAGFEKLFSAALVRYGMRNSYLKIIYPMLFRIGLIWRKDEMSPSQEHFLSNLIKQKIHASIDGLTFPSNDKKCWLLFLPKGETHEIGLLFANYLIRSAGQKTIYLGSDVPFDSLSKSITDTQPTDIFFFFVRNRPEEEAQNYLDKLCRLDTKTTIHIAGNTKIIEHLKMDKTVIWIQSVEELEKQLL